MDKDKQHILDLITGMWYNDLTLENGAEDFENWCEDNIENERQRKIMNRVKDHVDRITFILDEED